MRYERDYSPLYEDDFDEFEEDDFDDFEDDDFDDEFEDDIESVGSEEIADQLKIISDKLGISGKMSKKDSNLFVYSLSSIVKVNIRFSDEIEDITTEIKNNYESSGDNIWIDCTDDTTEISNISDYLNTAILLIKNIQDKLM